MRSRSKKEMKKFYFCWSCRIDLRSEHIDIHNRLGHKVKKHEHDPRDERYPVKEIKNGND